MKSVQKCVRLSEAAVCYIEAYPGENFSSKLENLAVDVDERRQLVSDLDVQLSTKQDELRALNKKIRGYRAMDARLGPLIDSLLSVLGEGSTCN